MSLSAAEFGSGRVVFRYITRRGDSSVLVSGGALFRAWRVFVWVVVLVKVGHGSRA